MDNVFTAKGYFKPFNYPQAYEFFEKQSKTHWVTEEANLSSDIEDWRVNLSDSEKNLITQILRFFTQGDADVATAYYNKYIPMFENEEIRMMLGTFASMEIIHADAYSAVVDNVGMRESEYKAFQNYEEMAAKHDYMFGERISGLTKEQKTLLDIAVFSAFGEGLQLFSSFAILFNFARHGKMKGMGNIVEWSVRDESLHVEGMLWLFSEIVNQNKALWTDEFKGHIYQTARDMVDLEDAFVDRAFELGGVEGLEPEDVKRYIRFIADRRLLQLGLKPNFGVKENPLPWMNDILGGISYTNFFEERSTGYAKGSTTGKWEDVF